jgi:hypothetical protein
MALRTRYAFEELGLEKLVTTVFEGNRASRRELESECGFRAGSEEYGGGRSLVQVRNAPRALSRTWRVTQRRDRRFGHVQFD